MHDGLLVLQNELQKTILFITHDLDEALKLGDSIPIFWYGFFIRLGSQQEIILKPADDYGYDLIQEINRSRIFKVASMSLTLIAYKQTWFIIWWRAGGCAKYVYFFAMSARACRSKWRKYWLHKLARCHFRNSKVCFAKWKYLLMAYSCFII